MNPSNAELIRGWFEQVWNRGRAEEIDHRVWPDLIAHGLTDLNGKPVSSPEGFKAFHRAFRGAFPDIQIAVIHTVCEGEFAVARCTVRGTHTGDGLGVPPTGRRMEFSGTCTMRFRGGRMAEAWNDFDFLTFYRQLGIPQPAG